MNAGTKRNDDKTKPHEDATVTTRVPKPVAHILDLDPRVRHVILLDSNGRPLLFVGRPSKTPLLETEAGRKMFFTRYDILLKTARMDEQSLGKTEVLIDQRDRVILFWFVYGKDSAVIVSTEPDFELGMAAALRVRVDEVYPDLVALAPKS